MRLRTGLRLLNRFFLTISSQEKQLSTSSSRNNIVREYKINIRISNFTIYPLSRPACMCASLICPQHRSRGLRMVQRLSSVNIISDDIYGDSMEPANKTTPKTCTPTRCDEYFIDI